MIQCFRDPMILFNDSMIQGWSSNVAPGKARRANPTECDLWLRHQTACPPWHLDPKCQHPLEVSMTLSMPWPHSDWSEAITWSLGLLGHHFRQKGCKFKQWWYVAYTCTSEFDHTMSHSENKYLDEETLIRPYSMEDWRTMTMVRLTVIYFFRYGEIR